MCIRRPTGCRSPPIADFSGEHGCGDSRDKPQHDDIRMNRGDAGLVGFIQLPPELKLTKQRGDDLGRFSAAAVMFALMDDAHGTVVEVVGLLRVEQEGVDGQPELVKRFLEPAFQPCEGELVEVPFSKEDENQANAYEEWPESCGERLQSGAVELSRSNSLR